jgi:hypothetical protein
MIGYATRALVIIGMCAASTIAAALSAQAAGRFDGRWSAVLTTESGPCQPSYRGEVEVVNGVVQALGGQSGLAGRVSANGNVVVTGSLGPISGVATGRLSGNSGSGTWRATIQEGTCTGSWIARRE